MQAEKIIPDSALSDVVPHHEVQLPHTWFSLKVDSAVSKLGEWISWVWPLLMAIIMTNVVMRYLFGEGRIEFEELQWHLYAVGFLGAMSFCYTEDAHVRVDVLHEGFPLKAKAWVELFGISILLLPFISLIIYYGLPFVVDAWESHEKSGSPGGLPYRWVIKAVLPVTLVLLGVAAVSRLSRVFCFLFLQGPSPKTGNHSATLPGGDHGNQ